MDWLKSRFDLRILVGAVLFGLAVGFLETVTDFLIFHRGDFWDQALFRISPHEVYIRTLILLSILTFGFIASRYSIKRRNLEHILLQQQEEKARYLDLIGGVLLKLDREGRIKLINKKGLALLGVRSQDEMIGRNWFEHFVPEEWRSELRERYIGMLQGTHAVEPIEYPILTEEGLRLISWQNSLVREPSGRVLGMLNFGSDITEQRATEEARQTAETRVRQLNEELGEQLAQVRYQHRLLDPDRQYPHQCLHQGHPGAHRRQ